MSHEIFDDMAEELAAQDRFDREQQRARMAHPDCRDPDHPGCEHCEDDDADD